MTNDIAEHARLEEVEHRRLASLVAGDIKLARSMHAEDYELISPGGRAYTREEYLGSIASGELRYEVFEAESPIRVHVIGAAGIVRYQARIRVHFGDDVDEGLFWHTDFYALRDGRLQAVWSHATRIRAAEASA